MKRNNTYLTHFLLAACFQSFVFFSVQAQEIRFSQFQAVPMLLNPALAANSPDYALHLNYRLQTIGLMAYRTGYFSFSMPVYDKSQEPRQVGGLALGAISDVAGAAGEVITTGASLTAAYKLLFDTYGVQSLTFGLQGEFIQTRIDFGQLNWPSQITYYGFDPSRRPADQYENRDSYLRFNAGLLWSYNPANNQLRTDRNTRYYAGFAVSNLNSPAQSFLRNGSYQVPLLYKLHGGAEVPLNGPWRISPSFMVMSQQGFYQFNVGAMLSVAKNIRSPSNPKVTKVNLFAGSWYRSADALVLSLGAYNRRFSAGFSYDLNAMPQKAGIQSQGAVELSLALRFLKEKSPRQLPTPLF